MKNVLLLHVDQQRYDALGCNGSPSAVTPHIDRLAAEGTRCERHVVTNPICMPSRASLLTGLYPTGHGVWCNGVALPRREFMDVRTTHMDVTADLGEPVTLADHLGAAGYRTASFGKLHLQPNLARASHGFVECREAWEAGRYGDHWHGPYYGFKHVDMSWGHSCLSDGHYRLWLEGNHPEVFARLAAQEQEGGPVASLGDLYAAEIPEELHHSAWTADRAIDWLSRREGDAPFFAFVGFMDPHHPFTPPAVLAETFKDAPVADPVDPEGKAIAGTLYAQLGNSQCAGLAPEERRLIRRMTDAMNHGIDNAVGRILACLEERGILDDTVICYTSDHGDWLGDHGLLRKNMVGADALVRVPLVIRAPGGGLPQVVTTPVSACDVFPTLCALAGVAAPQVLHGRDLCAVADDPAHLAFAQCFGSRAAGTNFTAYDARYRYTVYPDRRYRELFDHAADPGECDNLAEDPAHAAVVADLHHAVEAHLLQTVRPNLGRVCAW